MSLWLLMGFDLPKVPVSAATFDPPAIVAWHQHIFRRPTEFDVTTLDGVRAVHARCDDAGSALVQAVAVDLAKTPILEWRWRVDELAPPTRDERTKAGDDFAARLVVAHDGGAALWRTRAITYVWASAQPRGSDWPNPYGAQVHMVALRSTEDAGSWHVERRDLRADFARYAGLRPGRIDAVSIMTDCENTPGRAEAWYGDIRFLPAE